jgi:hypothetical protein
MTNALSFGTRMFLPQRYLSHGKKTFADFLSAAHQLVVKTRSCVIPKPSGKLKVEGKETQNHLVKICSHLS